MPSPRPGSILPRVLEAVGYLLDRAAYRTRQFLRGLYPRLAPLEVAEARARLTPAEFTLFLHARPRDRRHSMDLFHALRRTGVEGHVPSEELLVAALVHDVGKGDIETWHRIAFVLLNAVSPALARRLEARDGTRWRHALWRLRHHAALGAEMLEAAGSSPRVIEVVRAHTQPLAGIADAEVRAFIRADDTV